MSRYLWVAWCALALLPSSARATVIAPVSFSELVSSADTIVHGRVVTQEARWADGRRRIETLVTLEISESLKGGLGSTVTFRVPGGELGGYRTLFVGAPVFHPGDEVILFLRARGASWPVILGLNQGAFRVVAQTGAGDRVVMPAVPEHDTVEIAGGRRRLTLSEFAQRVRGGSVPRLRPAPREPR